MTTKAEKLARELAALRLRYSERDFDEAARLLQTGDLFAPALAAARAAPANRRQSVHKPGQGRAAKDTSPVAAEHPNVLSDREISDLVRPLDDAERAPLAHFAIAFENRSLLATGSAVRTFSEQLGLELPRTLPSRTVLLKRLLTRLLALAPEPRERLLQQAPRLANTDSALQRWSELIVKHD